MPHNISLAQFDAIASGKYNAGQIDIATDATGAKSLVKVNNHVWFPSWNNALLSSQRVLEVKEAFLEALAQGGVSPANIVAIRQRLGLPADFAATGDRNQLSDLHTRRFTPLSRAEVRSILDTYVPGRVAAPVSPRIVAKRDSANAGFALKHVADYNFHLTDAISLLSASRSLAELDDSRAKRFDGPNAVNESRMATAMLRDDFKTLFAAALKLLQGNVHESGTFSLLGLPAKLVKDQDGKLSAVLGKDPSATKVSLGVCADRYVDFLVGRVLKDRETLGAPVVKSVLGMVYDRDIEGGLVVSERTSRTRHFAAALLECNVEDARNLVRGNYNTGLLVEIAERMLDGSDEVDTKAKLDALHAQLLRDNSGLPDDMKAMLAQVANIPLERPSDPKHELLVRRSVAGPIAPAVAAIPNPPPNAVPVPRAKAVKDFVADLVFSDETMVSDVVVNRPGETMRNILSQDAKCAALAEIIANPAVLDAVSEPTIVGVLKSGFRQMKDVLDAAFRAANNGETLDAAAQRPDFAQRFQHFLRDAGQLPGVEIAKFDNIIQTMAKDGCEAIQVFVNGVFAVRVGAQTGAQAGAVTTDPYKDRTAAQIKAELAGKSLNEIVDAASTSDAPGQVGFFRQVISSYFVQLRKESMRSAFASALRFADVFDFAGKQGAELDSAKKAALNKFTGAILKGASPLLQKMMQGLPKEIMGDYADALEDMKANLAPIPRKIVQAYLMKMIDDSNGKITAIEIKQSLGAASVGEAFLCTFTCVGDNGRPMTQDLVVKIMRHDAEKRVRAEADIFTAAAARIPGMAKTWEGQLAQYLTEFDFRNEATNVAAGRELYAIKDPDPANAARLAPLTAIAPNVSSMKMSELVPPQKNVMVAEVAPGVTVDKLFKQVISTIRNAADVVFEHDPATGRVLWRDGIDPTTGKPAKVPVFKADFPETAAFHLQMWLSGQLGEFSAMSQNLLQATKAWFHQAIFGNGKFHGDTHAGNLMLNGPNQVTFIDFGNLYTLDEKNADGVNEKRELLRVLMGAAFRDTNTFLAGMGNLLSSDGKGALAEKRAKAVAILDAVLSREKGSFSFNIVYRLRAAVIELQKLGLELPPQINCFIQSLVRLSNSVTEINTIMNQCRMMSAMIDALDRPAPVRDELDLVGQAFDIFASKEGKKIETVTRWGIKYTMPAYLRELTSDRFGGTGKSGSMFSPDGEYAHRVAARIGGAADPVAEARRLVAINVGHCDSDHDLAMEDVIEKHNDDLKTFQAAFAAAQTPEDKASAIQAFAQAFASREGTMLGIIENQSFLHIQMPELQVPDTFASAITSILFGNLDAMLSGLNGSDKDTIGKSVLKVATGEINAPLSTNLQVIEKAFLEDAQKMGGDRSYKIDIGI